MLSTAGGIFCVRDLLNNAVKQFDPVSELEWTAVSFAYYLPPQRTWTNRFSEEYNFDDLVTFLIQRPFDVSSCGGSHSLYALATIQGVDAQVSILSTNARRRLQGFLKAVSRTLVASQKHDGSVDPLWYLQLSNLPEYLEWLPQRSQSQSNVARLSRKNEWRDMLTKISPFSSHMLITGHVCEAGLLLPSTQRFFLFGGSSISGNRLI